MYFMRLYESLPLDTVPTMIASSNLFTILGSCRPSITAPDPWNEYAVCKRALFRLLCSIMLFFILTTRWCTLHSMTNLLRDSPNNLAAGISVPAEASWNGGGSQSSSLLLLACSLHGQRLDVKDHRRSALPLLERARDQEVQTCLASQLYASH